MQFRYAIGYIASLRASTNRPVLPSQLGAAPRNYATSAMLAATIARTKAAASRTIPATL
jgi:hypothetical protein